MSDDSQTTNSDTSLPEKRAPRPESWFIRALGGRVATGDFAGGDVPAASVVLARRGLPSELTDDGGCTRGFGGYLMLPAAAGAVHALVAWVALAVALTDCPRRTRGRIAALFAVPPVALVVTAFALDRYVIARFLFAAAGVVTVATGFGVGVLFILRCAGYRVGR